ARRLLGVDVVSSERRLELVLVKREQRRDVAARMPVGSGAAGDAAAVLLARGALQLGEALKAECLAEPHDGRARRVGAPRQLLGGLEGDLIEVVDDVLRDVLLRA